MMYDDDLPDVLNREFVIVPYPPIPEMTPENSEYCDKYVAGWGFYSPFDRNFSESDYFTEFHPCLADMIADRLAERIAERLNPNDWR